MIISLPIADRPRSYAFYQEAFGFRMVLGDQPVAPTGTSECLLSIHAESEAAVDAQVAKAVAAGAKVVTAPVRKAWAYLATFTDPDGHLWMVETT